MSRIRYELTFTDSENIKYCRLDFKTEEEARTALNKLIPIVDGHIGAINEPAPTELNLDRVEDLTDTGANEVDGLMRYEAVESRPIKPCKRHDSDYQIRLNNYDFFWTDIEEYNLINLFYDTEKEMLEASETLKEIIKGTTGGDADLIECIGDNKDDEEEIHRLTEDMDDNYKTVYIINLLGCGDVLYSDTESYGALLEIPFNTLEEAKDALARIEGVIDKCTCTDVDTITLDRAEDYGQDWGNYEGVGFGNYHRTLIDTIQITGKERDGDILDTLEPDESYITVDETEYDRYEGYEQSGGITIIFDDADNTYEAETIFKDLIKTSAKTLCKVKFSTNVEESEEDWEDEMNSGYIHGEMGSLR